MDPNLNQVQQDPPVPIESPAPPKPNPASNTLIVLLVVLSFILFASTGYLAFQNYQLKVQAKNSVGYGLPSPTPSATSDPTADWKTYSGSDYSFKYPADWSLRDPSDVFLLNPNKTVSITISKDQYPYGGAGNIKKETIKIDVSIDGKVIETTETISNDKSAYVDFAIGDYHVLYGTGYPAVGTAESLSDYSLAKATIAQILSTFKFNTNSQTPTAKPVVSPPLLDTSSWKPGTLGNVSFKYPSDYSLEPYQDSVTLRKTSTAPGGHYVSINIYTYDGNSRRQWYIDRLHTVGGDSLASIEKYTLAQEVRLGTVDALDFWMDRGWWQGGGGSPIVIAEGKTILTVTDCCNRNYNFETGQSTRGNVSDTVGSTIKFTN